MIGIIADNRNLAVVEEFFQLFKTPWETCRSGKRYPVVLSAVPEAPRPECDLAVVYELYPEGTEGRSSEDSASVAVLLDYRDRRFPVYAGYSSVHGPGTAIITREDTAEVVGLESSGHNCKIVRIGYDLFREVGFLLSTGQPVEHAGVPTLDIHISILRNLIVESGIPLAEIPPVPPGCELIICLTHDVDFTAIRLHRLDRTVLGFIYRATVVSVLRFLKGQLPFGKLLKNLQAVLLLPLIHFGLVWDFFNQFERYLHLEGDLKSPYFLVPYKDVAGRSFPGRDSRGRATAYDVDDIGPEIAALLAKNCEVGLHGIDAWVDPARAEQERARIRQATGIDPKGLRMHWLFFSEDTPRILDNAGFTYDSTLGYNDCVGFRAGTAQVFRLPGATRLLELPLNVQDTALFSTERMGLTQKQGIGVIKKMVEKIRMSGGVLTVNWHQRSLGPERLWDDPYRYLLRLAKEGSVWAAPAREVVEWFDQRRSAEFTEVDLERRRIRVSSRASQEVQGLVLRLYNLSAGDTKQVTDIGFSGDFVLAE